MLITEMKHKIGRYSVEIELIYFKIYKYKRHKWKTISI